MKQHKNKGFTALELVGVIVIIVILAAISIPAMFGSKSQATTVRSRDEAAALNAAEGNYYDYRYKTGPALTGVNPIVDTYTTDPATRINNLAGAGYLTSVINTNDVLLNASSDLPVWSPAYP